MDYSTRRLVLEVFERGNHERCSPTISNSGQKKAPEHFPGLSIKNTDWRDVEKLSPNPSVDRLLRPKYMLSYDHVPR